MFSTHSTSNPPRRALARVTGGAALALLVALAPWSDARGGGEDTISYDAALDGETIAPVISVSGGAAAPEHLEAYNAGALADAPLEPVDLVIGIGAAPAVYDWISESLELGFAQRDVSLVTSAPGFEKANAIALDGAYLGALTLPVLDKLGVDLGAFTLKIDPEVIRYEKSKGLLPGDDDVGAKKWRCSNFRIELGPLPCDRVSKIDSFSWEQKVVRDEVGKFVQPEDAANISLPRLTLTIELEDLDPWLAWQDALAEAKDDGSLAVDGALELLDDEAQPLLSFGLDGVVLDSLEVSPEDAPDSFTVELELDALSLTVE